MSGNAADKQNKPPVSPTPRPKKMIDIFKGKKEEITSKLHDGDANQELIRLTSTKKPKARKNDDNGWISLIKTELTERSTSPNRQTNKTVAKAPLRSPFLQPGSAAADDKKTKFQFIQNQRKKSDACDSFPAVREEQPRSPACPRCVRCNQQVATVDRILISGVLLHRACLVCSRCGITLRLSEVRDGAGDDVCNFNYLCILCSKNRVNIASKQSSDRMTTSLDGCLLVTRPPPAPGSPNQQRRQAAAEKSAASSFAATDEYELRLRERMKWKEQFLLNNNNIDFGPLVKREVFKTNSAGLSECNHLSDESSPGSHLNNQSKASQETAAGAAVRSEANNDVTSSIPESASGGTAAGPSSSNKHKINERIEYENVSNSFELYDDDELTKMLNLESGDQWESGEEESTSSGSWRRSEDSTDADFDSDEFDLSHASKQAERKRQEANKQKVEAEQEAIVVPEIVVQADDDAVATSEEIDTAVLDTAGGLSMHLHESTLDQISETDSLEAQHVAPAGLLASSSAPLAKKEYSAQTTCSNSDSDSGESHTLADVMGKRGLLASFSDSRSPDSRPISKEADGDDDTVNTSVSSLSCCDVSGTFEDLNLLSLLEEEDTTGRGSASVDAAKRKGLAAGSTASSLLTSNSITNVASMQTGEVTASAPAPTPTTNNNTHSNRTNAESAVTSTASSCTLLRSHSPASNPSSTGRLFSTSKELLLPGDNLSSSTASSGNPNSLSSKSTTVSNINTGSTSSSMRATSFKVAQPKFTVFNFELQLPPASTSSAANHMSSTLTLKTPPNLTLSRKADIVGENVIKSSPFVPSRGSASGGLSGPPTHQDHETYSKIPVLATRVNESNASPKGKPSYSGSFTEKLMLRCRSSPTLHGKENLKSADGGGSSGPAYQSVLAKWACNNLFQMERSSSPATYSVMDLLSRARSNDTSSRNSSVDSDPPDPL